MALFNGGISVPATVVSRSVVRETDIDQSHLFNLLVEIEYKINGKSYICKDIYLGMNHSFRSEESANKFMPDLKPNAPIFVFVNPNRHSESIVSKKTHFILQVAAVAIAIAVLWNVASILSADEF
jgi:hypothetical protein